MTKQFFEEVLSSEISDDDWKKIFDLELKPVHKSYLEIFRENRNRPMPLREVWNKDEGQFVSPTPERRITFDQISQALRGRETEYRIRAIERHPQGSNRYRIVKVAPRRRIGT